MSKDCRTSMMVTSRFIFKGSVILVESEREIKMDFWALWCRRFNSNWCTHQVPEKC